MINKIIINDFYNSLMCKINVTYNKKIIVTYNICINIKNVIDDIKLIFKKNFNEINNEYVITKQYSKYMAEDILNYVAHDFMQIINIKNARDKLITNLIADNYYHNDTYKYIINDELTILTNGYHAFGSTFLCDYNEEEYKKLTKNFNPSHALYGENNLIPLIFKNNYVISIVDAYLQAKKFIDLIKQ